jgi:uncharacterized protein (DUF4415 family)
LACGGERSQSSQGAEDSGEAKGRAEKHRGSVRQVAGNQLQSYASTTLKHVATAGCRPARDVTTGVRYVDNDVFQWLKSLGKGYQNKLNRLLRAAMEASQER